MSCMILVFIVSEYEIIEAGWPRDMILARDKAKQYTTHKICFTIAAID